MTNPTISPEEIYSIILDNVNSASCNVGYLYGESFELYRAYGTSDKEMIEQGFIRVEYPEITDGMETIWAKLWEINNAYRKRALPLIKSEQIWKENRNPCTTSS